MDVIQQQLPGLAHPCPDGCPPRRKRGWVVCRLCGVMRWVPAKPTVRKIAA